MKARMFSALGCVQEWVDLPAAGVTLAVGLTLTAVLHWC